MYARTGLVRALIASAAMKFPLLTSEAAKRRQAKKLIKARNYLETRGIYAVMPGNKFDYKLATGSVL